MFKGLSSHGIGQPNCSIAPTATPAFSPVLHKFLQQDLPQLCQHHHYDRSKYHFPRCRSPCYQQSRPHENLRQDRSRTLYPSAEFCMAVPTGLMNLTIIMSPATSLRVHAVLSSPLQEILPGSSFHTDVIYFLKVIPFIALRSNARQSLNVQTKLLVFCVDCLLA